MLHIFFDGAPRCFAERVGYTFLSQIVGSGIGAISILQLVHLCLYFGHPLLVLVDDVSWHSTNSEIDLKRVLLSFNTVLVAVSRNFLNTVVITFVLLPLQFPEASQITLLLLLPLLLNPGFFWGLFLELALVQRVVDIQGVAPDWISFDFQLRFFGPEVPSSEIFT